MDAGTAGGGSSTLPDVGALWLSLKVAALALALVLPAGLLAAWWLGVGKPFRGKALIETLLTLPLVLPPTVVGFALIFIFGRGTALGRFLNDAAGLHLLFTWPGVAVAGAIMALPLFVRTGAAALAAVDPELVDVGRTLGASETTLLFRVLVPLAYRGLLAGLVLAFARALGEFGAALMIGGNIAGQTQTLPLALYSAWQAGRDGEALADALLLALIAFLLLLGVGAWAGRVAAGRGEQQHSTR